MNLTKTIRSVFEIDSLLACYLFYGLSVLFIAAGFFIPTLINNETVYLLPAKRLLDPDFLMTDWTYGGTKTVGLSYFYSVFLSLFWLISSDPIVVALTSRLVLWCGVVFAIFHLARANRVPPCFAFIGIVLFSYSSQSLAAGEWIIGGSEQKVLAYIFAILSLSFFLNGRFIMTGFLTGLALNSHALVGGFAALAQSSLVLYFYYKNRIPLSVLFHFALPIALLAVPVLFVTLNYLGTPLDIRPIASVDINEFLVLFRTPHHLDPYSFFSLKRILISAFFVVVLCYVLIKDSDNEYAKKILLVYLSPLVGIYLIGIIARVGGLYILLKFYPFRAADSLVPLFFFLFVPYFLYRTAINIRPQPSNILIFLLLFIVTIYISLLSAKKFVNQVSHNYDTWQNQSVEGHKRQRLEFVAWASENTASTDVFLANPFWFEFWLQVERPIVVSFKSCPANSRFYSWYNRMLAINKDQPFTKRGFSVHKEVTLNFQKLSSNELLKIRDDFNAAFYVVKKERKDLKSSLVFNNKAYYVYRLATLRP